MKNLKIKNFIISILILSSLTVFIIIGIPREEAITKVKSSYGRVFPEKITYKEKKALIEYKIDLKLKENSIKKDPNSDKYYAEYRGTIRPESFTFK